MDKSKILDELTKNVTVELNQLKASYEATKELVQKGDIKSEGKYDTRATEANYLADGQRHRIAELEQELQLLEEIDIKTTHENVSIGSLVEIDLNGTQRKYFIAPTAGGTMVNLNGEVILVISVFSPIGDAVLGLAKEDVFEVEIKGDTREYQVIDFY